MTSDASPVSATHGTKGADGPREVAPPAGPPAFDDHRPPSAELAADCVHCGFCLPTCPTYVLWGEEMDSPRGRIYLMKEGLEGEPMSDSMVSHWDACLGCMACVTACPSGVQYDRLIEQTRAQVERLHDRSAKDRALRGLIFSLFPHPRRLRLLRGPLRALQRSGLDKVMRRTGLLERMAPQLAAMESLAPRLGSPEPLPSYLPATGQRRAVVGLLT
ncbi:MAG: glycolate oxidase iron-sulfur subunit, partial [Actinomycetota bacterium]|nr:glycolate oxidase iron-sulfur subunit [Actinomycetota bacterium]